MRKIIQKTEKIIDQFLETIVNPLIWAGGFAGIIGLRMLVERIIVPFSDSPFRILTDYLHNIFFFLISYLVIWLIMAKILKIKPAKLAFLFLCASWLIVLPPILDIIRTGGGVYWSFYALGNLSEIMPNLWTFFGNLPSGIVYFGTKIIFALTILLIFGLIWLKTKKLTKSFVGAFLAYLTLFVMGTFPAWVSYLYYFSKFSESPEQVQGFQIAQFFGAPRKLFGLYFGDLMYTFPYSLDLIYFLITLFLLGLLFFVQNKAKSVAILKNARYPQLIYHFGLFFTGLGLGVLAYRDNFNLNIFSVFATLDLLAGVALAWLASVIINDIYDFKIDEISNPERPLQKKVFETGEYLNSGILFFILSVLGGLVVDVRFALLLFFYQFLAWAYSASPFRLKKFPVIATLVSSLASLLVVFMGFILISGDQNIAGLSGRIIILLVVALTLSLPIKDFKDIEGDRKYRIWTVPVLFGEETGRLITAIGIFISFMLSVFMLNEFRLFWWALLFGIIAFLIVINQKIKPRRLFWWVLGTVAAYGVILIRVLFL